MSQREKLIVARQNMANKLNKRLRKATRLTPWRDVWELESVGRGLLSVLQLPSSTIEQALDTVNVWKARSHALEGLPHAVESTAALALVYWRDHIQGGASLTELRLAYSSAVVRCINGFADALQQQRFVAAPVSILCGQLGIPSWLVDIRHEASHNALPTLPVLRLATVTLLEYLQREYWIPTCTNWDVDQDHTSLHETNPQHTTIEQRGIDMLLQYKRCASKPVPTSVPIKDNAAPPMSEKGLSKTSPKPFVNEPVASKPFDTFFGDNDAETSDEDDDDDWEDPVLGSFWGSTLGTNANRFAVLQPPKKSKEQTKKKKPKKPKKPPQQKKGLGEKYPIDYAKDFVEAMSPQLGYSLAIRFLVWGGVGGAPVGRGVLIPGSLVAFPASSQGVRKSWERYHPLLEVLGRVWPGFLAALLIHLVDFVLSIEAACTSEGSMDAGSARKLFFLSSWIRLLVSQDLVQRLYPEAKEKGRKGSTVENPPASLEQLDPLQYPLNSLCDRCCLRDGPEEFSNTSRYILQTFEEVLGAHRVMCHGVGPIKVEPEASSDGPDEKMTQGPALSTGEMSLDEMEVLLLSDENDIARPPETLTAPRKDTEQTEAPRNRPMAWTRCLSWDGCSLGTMPGLPV
jgi:ribosomal biogenesis protein LAS1